MEYQKTSQLRRELNLLDAVGIGIGAVVGAGIFVVSGLAAQAAGPSLLVSLVLAGIAATANGLSSAQLAAVFPKAGGTYEYGYQVISPEAGFLAGWMFLASKLAAGGVVALGFGNYLNQLIPAINPTWAAVGAAIVLISANLLGIQKAGKLNLAIVSVTLLGLLYLIISGLPQVKVTSFTPFFTGGMSGVLQATALIFFAFTGYARIATLGEEVREPSKTIPKAIIITLATTATVYLLIMFVAIGVLGAGPLGESAAPLFTTAEKINSPGLVTIIGLAAVTAMLGVLLSQILGISRMLFAMGRRRDLPAFFEKTDQKSSVPVISVLFTGVVILILVLLGNLPQIAATASFTILLYYSIANIAAWRLPEEQRRFPRVVQVIGLTFCIAMAFSLDWQVILTGLGVLLAGFVLRAIVRRFYKQTV
ncbi:MAG: amino acid permease [Anaerolineaceae bacterium]|nr:amino acid permease [Anaerolineaceae bacterium]MDD4042614.1 amino acid permease [Anaerolineaceae bacterium]MDD4577829.1 amino acid permease [Anaerolineaceae bacterium]